MEPWLTEILPQLDSDFETYFANGYFLSQLLYSLGLMENFGKIVNSDRFADKNLAQVAATLELIGIELDADRIKARTSGYVRDILRTLHEKVQLASSQKVPKKKKVSAALETVDAATYEDRQKKFEQERMRQVAHAIHSHQEQEEAFKKVRDRQYLAKHRQDHLDTISANHIFMQQWEAEGKKNWAANQQVKAKRQTHLLSVKTKQAKDFKGNQLRWIKEHQQEVKQDIRDFENTLIRLGIDHKEGQTVKKKNQNLATEAAVTMARIKENKIKNDLAAKERESRQRAVQVERVKSEMLAKAKEGLGKLGHFYAVWSRKHQENSFKRVKKFIQAKALFETTLEKFHLAEESKTLRLEAMQEAQALELAELERMKLKDKPKLIQERAARVVADLTEKHEISRSLCMPLLDQILELAEVINTDYEELGGITEEQWAIYQERFVKGEQAEGAPSDEEIGEALVDIECESPSLTRPSTFRSALPIDSYIDANQEWGFGLAPLNNFYLGDVLEAIADVSWPPVRQTSIPEAPHYLPLKLCITGPSFSGKHTHAKRLSEKYSLRSFETDELVSEAQRALQKQKDIEDGKKPQPLKKGQVEEPVNEEFLAAAKQLAENGTETRILVELFRQKLRCWYGDQPTETPKNQGIVLLGWPKSLEEAELLERGLIGYVPDHELPEQEATIKKREAAIVAKPSEKPPPPPAKLKSFFDIFLWLDVKLPTCIRRAVDRRVDVKGNVFNLTFNPPPDNMLAKVKPIDDPAHTEEQLTTKHQAFAERTDELYGWLSQLGSQDWDCLHFFDADLPLDQVSEVIDQKIELFLQAKRTEQASFHTSSIIFRDEAVEFGQEAATSLWAKWDDGLHAYLADLQATMGTISSNKEKVVANIEKMLADFLELLRDNGPKQEILDDFISQIAPRLTGPLTSQQVSRLVGEVERLSDLIWDQIESSKGTALEKRAELLESAKVDDAKFYRIRIALHLLRVESRYLVHIVNLIGAFENARLGTNVFEDVSPPNLKLDVKSTQTTLAVSSGSRTPMLQTLIADAKEFMPMAGQECFKEAIDNYL